MVQSIAVTDHSDSPAVQQLKDELEGCRSLHAQLDTVHIMAARYQVGQHWRAQDSSQAGIVIPPKISAANPIVTANEIGAMIRQWDGRLMVTDFSAKFKPLDSRPGVHLTARQLLAWYNYWTRESNLTGWYADLSFFRLITGTAIGTWYFDEDAPGGVGLDVMHPGRLTINPANRSWDLDDHECVVESTAISADEARRRVGRYFTDDKPFQSDARLSDLRGSESYLGSALYNLQPGAGESRSTGVIVHRRFFKRYQRLQIFVENPRPTYKRPGLRTSDFFIAKPPAGNGNDANSWEWKYGNPYLKLDCFRNVAMAFANGLVLELVPMQNLINLALRAGLGGFISRAGYRWFAHRGTVENPATLQSGREGSVVWLSTAAFRNKIFPQAVAPPRFDTSADALFQQARGIMSSLSHVTPTLQGESVKRGQATSAYELLRRQGLVPLEAVAALDQQRLERFLNRLSRAVLDWYGRTNSRFLSDIIGRSFSSPALARVAGGQILKGSTTCVLRDGAFLAQTRQEKEARIMGLFQAGRLQGVNGLATAEELPYILYEITGYPTLPGMEEAYQTADAIVERVIHDDRDADIYQGDPLYVIDRVIKRVLSERIKHDYSREQITRLQAAQNRVKRLLAIEVQGDAALNGLRATLAGPGAQVPPNAGAASEPMMQEPQMQELQVA